MAIYRYAQRTDVFSENPTGPVYRVRVEQDPDDKSGCMRPVASTWAYMGYEGTGGIGHYTTQGYRAQWVRRTRRGDVLLLTSGPGYWPASGGGYDWCTRTVLEVVEQPTTTMLVALSQVEDADPVTA